MKRITALSKGSWFLGSLVILFVAIVLWNIPIEKRKYGLSQNSLLTDYTGLLPERVERIVKAENSSELQKIVKQANKNHQQISVAGLQHSQGGHTYYKDGVVINVYIINVYIKLC